jgi:hypothetical protein
MTQRVINVEEFHRNRDRAMPESEVQDQIIEAARRAGFDLIYHTWNSQHSAAGFPDLVMLHRSGRMVIVECKREGKHPTKAQEDWLLGFERLRESIHPVERDPIFDDPPMVAVFVARPSNRQDIIDALAQYAGLE